jgi:hypothetical protein
MKKALVIPLDDQELLELYHVILDEDAEGALRFATEHLRRPLRRALEGG